HFLHVAAVTPRLRALVEGGIGYERYAVQGGDWGAVIAARMAFEAPRRACAGHGNARSVLPLPPNLDHPPLTDAEGSYLEAAQRWRLRHGFHLLVQPGAPPATAHGLNPHTQNTNE